MGAATVVCRKFPAALMVSGKVPGSRQVKTMLLELLVPILILIVLDLVSVRFGTDSRDDRRNWYI